MSNVTVGDYNIYPELKLRSVDKLKIVSIFEEFTNQDISVMELSKKHNVPFQKLSWLIEQHLLPTRAEETRIITIQSKV